MRNKILLTVFAFTLTLLLTSSTEDNNGKAGRTGSPGEQTCYNGCHSSYSLNSGPGSVALTSDIPVDGYTPNQTYNMHLTVTHAGVSLFGLGLEALTTTNANAGTLTAGVGSTIKTTTISGVSRRNITHSLGGGVGTTGYHSFDFTWKAPAAGTGNVTFYFTGVAADGNNHNSGDYVYSGTQPYSEYVVPSSVNNISSSQSALNIYPNPGKGVFTVSYDLENEVTVEAGIYTLSGELIQPVILSGHIGSNQQQVMPEKQIPAGIYLLKVTAGGQTSSKKLIIE